MRSPAHAWAVWGLMLATTACGDSTAAEDSSVLADSATDAPIRDAPPTVDSSLPIPEDCRDAQLTFVDPVPTEAVHGSVFSLTPYALNVAESHQPVPVVVRLTKDGTPVVGCPVAWDATGGGLSWAFPEAQLTDGAGEARAWWVSGNVAAPELSARVLEGTPISVTGNSVPGPATRTNSMHIRYDVGPYDAIRARVTPVAGPATTYYSLLNWPGSYAGIQFVSDADEDVSCGSHSAPTCADCPMGNGEAWCNGDCLWVDGACTGRLGTGVAQTMVIFSTWDVEGGGGAEILSPGAANEVVGFGGEGTGVSTRLRLPPAAFGMVPGIPDGYTLEVGNTYEMEARFSYPTECADCTDIAVTFTDVTRGIGPIEVGSHRYHRRVDPTTATGFVEDWHSEAGDDCTNSGTRAAYFHDIAYQLGGADWIDVRTARVAANYLPGNNEICATYGYGADSSGFLVSSGGVHRVDAPIPTGSVPLALP